MKREDQSGSSPSRTRRTANPPAPETAESMAARQRDISVSEFFLKNRHLLGFDSPRRALLTAVKEAVDNSLDACEEAGIFPEILVEVDQLADNRFRVTVTDNGPGIVKQQIPKIFAKLLYGSKFHRLRMSRGQQGIGISAAGMYGQLTTGSAVQILSKIRSGKLAHRMAVQIDTRANKPVILSDETTEWRPAFQDVDAEGNPAGEMRVYEHGTSVSIEMEAQYQRGKQSVDEFLKQCAIVNPHLTLHYRLTLKPKADPARPDAGASPQRTVLTYRRAVDELPKIPREIMPHPHGVELGLLMQMLKDTEARTLRSALASDFSRVSEQTALQICQRAGLDPRTNPARIPPHEVQALYKAIQETKLMRPPTDCLSPIGEAQILAGLQKEIEADFYTAVTREPAVYRGNPFQIEAGLAYARPGESDPHGEFGHEEPIRLLRFANRVPLLYQPGACAITKAVVGVNWKSYGLNQPKGALPLGPVVLIVHMASVWVPFTSESKDAIASYDEILSEMTLALQECGRRLAVFLKRRQRDLEAARKRSYIETYIPHLALGLQEILKMSDAEKARVEAELKRMLERTHLETR
ncbi:MAG: DNA topoisomerase VI subunit B [Kiritimatiellae bacterium]|nr:DNA topoisomerase VI subunit B [Kiritimatiellia bacterium]MDW8458382.1 DNA topoisomerase VI subunit B [Verrucomicrobiota bacterium]